MTLSSVLPGLREIRGPLTAGYLYLLCVWMWFNDDLEQRRRTGPFADAYEILSALRPAELVIVVSIAAFLVGSLLDELRVQLGRAIAARTPIGSFSSAGRTMVGQFISNRIQTVSVELAGAGLGMTHELVPAQPSPESVRLELDRIRDSLVGGHGELLVEIDRSRSEADFRAAIAVPLLLLIGTFAAAEPPWGIGVVLVAGLAAQALRLQRHYGDKLAQALEAGDAKSPSVEVFDNGVVTAVAAATAQREYAATMRDGPNANERAAAAAKLITRLIQDHDIAVILHPDREHALLATYRHRVRRAYSDGVRIEGHPFADRPSIDTCRWLVDNDVLDGAASGPEETEAVRKVQERVRDAEGTGSPAGS